MPKKNMEIAAILAVVVIVVFVVLGFFHFGSMTSAAPAPTSPLAGPQELLAELSQTGTVAKLETYELSPGSGEGAKAGDAITVTYVGTLPDGTVFDSSAVHGGTPFSFTLGAGKVIQGWDQGLVGAKKGQKLLLAIPPALGYGANTVGTIPPNSTLIFEVTIVDVVPAQAGQ